MLELIKNKKNKYYLYTLLFFFAALFIFSSNIVRGKGFVSNGDPFNQNYPILTYLADYYRKCIGCILSGNSIPMYSSSIGLGDDIIGCLSWFGLGDVFLLPVIFCPEKYIGVAYICVTLLRFYLSGIAFLVFSNYKKYDERLSIICALMYSVCGYALCDGMIFLPFSTAMTLFPLLILGIERILDDDHNRKLHIKLILVIFLQAMTGFYFLYISILGCFVFFVVKIVLEKIYNRYSNRNILYKMLFLLLHLAIGLCMSAVLLIPVVIQYLQCARTGDSSFGLSDIFYLPSMATLKELFANILFPTNSLYSDGLGITVIAFLCIVYLLINYRTWKKEPIFYLLLLSIFGYFFPTIGIVTNGFAYESNRWYYMMFFVLACLTNRILPEMISNISKNLIGIYTLIFVAWMIIIYSISEISMNFIIRFVIYILIWSASLLLFHRIHSEKSFEKEKKNTNRLYFLVVINIAVTGFLLYAPRIIGGSGIGSSFQKINEPYDSITDSELSANDDSEAFHRIDFNDTSLNAPLMLGINSSYCYYSMCNGNVFNLYNKLRISPAIMQTFTLQGLDSRQVLESIFSVTNYAIDSQSNKIVENDYVLPLGFSYETYVTETQVNNMSELQKMNLMMTDVIIDDGDGVQNTESNRRSIEVDDDAQIQIPIEVNYSDDIETKADSIEVNEGSTITIKFDTIGENDDPGDETYLYLRNLTSNPSFKYDILVDDKLIRVLDKETEWYYEGNYDYLVQVDEAAKDGTIVLTFKDAGTYTLDGIELYHNDIADYKGKYEALKKNSLSNVKTTDNSISGESDFDEGRWVFISYPYSKGWNCKIDGESASIFKANYGFMTVYVPAGEHKLSFEYVTPGLRIGLIISLFAVGFLILILFIRWKSKNNNYRARLNDEKL